MVSFFHDPDQPFEEVASGKRRCRRLIRPDHLLQQGHRLYGLIPSAPKLPRIRQVEKARSKSSGPDIETTVVFGVGGETVTGYPFTVGDGELFGLVSKHFIRPLSFGIEPV